MSTDNNKNILSGGGETESNGGGTTVEPGGAQGAGDPAGSPPPPPKDRNLSPPVTVIPGAFTLVETPPEHFGGDKFDLKPNDDRPAPIPEDQRKVNHEVYALRNTLKFLKEKTKLPSITEDYDEFIQRVKQAARVGCTGPNVDTLLAAAALEDIRGDVVRRYGRTIAFQYLRALALWAAGGVVLGFIVIRIAQWSGIGALSGYGYLLAGSMVGAWLSVAASRWEIAFDGIQEFVDVSVEPFVRLLFVGLLATTFGLFLQLGVIPVNIGEEHLTTFYEKPQWALFLGIIAGIGEKGLSMKLLARAKEVFTTTS